MGFKFLYPLCIVVCFTVLCVRCDSSRTTSSFEEETVSGSYEDTKRSPYDDNSALEATHLNGGDGDRDHVEDRNQQIERFMVSVNGVQDGETSGTNRPYFMHQQQQDQQLRSAHVQPQSKKQQPPQMQQAAAAIQHTHHYHQPNRAPAPDRLNYDHPSAVGNTGGGVSSYNEQPDPFYQSGGGGGGDVVGGRGGEAISLDSTGFTDFVPSVGFRSTGNVQSVIPHLPSSPPSPFIASHNRQLPSHDGGSSGQMSFDTTGFGHESSPSVGYKNGGVGGSGHSSGGGSGADFDYPATQSHQAPIIHKSIYVHVAPPDDEPPRKQRVILPNVPPKKNYQIVFIKAPTSPPPTAPIIPPPPQHSDKTLIYVLHPKPEDAPPIHIPPPPVTQPLKPEVYFIKYKNREAAQGGGGGGVGAGGGGGGDYGGGGHGGVLQSPGEEFGGGGGDNFGYPHRRYGRGDQTPEPMESSSESSADGMSTAPAGAAADEDEDDAAVPEQRELIEATVAATAEAAAGTTAFSAAADETAEELQGRSAYSTEYNDASVDSTNLNEMHVLSTTAPKGKNGH